MKRFLKKVPLLHSYHVIVALVMYTHRFACLTTIIIIVCVSKEDAIQAMFERELEQDISVECL